MDGGLKIRSSLDRAVCGARLLALGSWNCHTTTSWDCRVSRLLRRAVGDIAVMDIGTGSVDGLTATRKIRRFDPRAASLCSYGIALLSQYAGPGRCAHHLLAPFNPIIVITKSWTPSITRPSLHGPMRA